MFMEKDTMEEFVNDTIAYLQQNFCETILDLDFQRTKGGLDGKWDKKEMIVFALL